MNNETNPSACDALKAYEAARAHAKILKERFNEAFDQHLETSDRPITLRDLMFALAAIDQIASTAVLRLKEILQKGHAHGRVFEGSAFDAMEHSNLRDVLFELYYSHAGTQFSEEFWGKFCSPWERARDEELKADRAYEEARKREGLAPGEKPNCANQK